MSRNVTGEKDGMVTRTNGSEEMNLQGVDYGRMSHLLAKGLQKNCKDRNT